MSTAPPRPKLPPSVTVTRVYRPNPEKMRQAVQFALELALRRAAARGELEQEELSAQSRAE